MAIHYEWDVEERDEHGDAQDHNHCGSYAECLEILRVVPPAGFTHHVVLVRDNDCSQRGQRSWAYMEGRGLPSMFTDAMGSEIAKVPGKFISEVDEENRKRK